MEVDEHNVTETFPHLHGVLSEVTAMYQPFVEKLFSENNATIVEGLQQIKSLVIGNNKQKSNFIVLGAVPRLVYLIQQENLDISTKTHCAVILGSLAKGMEANVKSLLDYGVHDVMLYGLRQVDLRFYEACLRCIRTIVMYPDNSGLLFVHVSIIPRLLEFINKSTCTQECTCEIISHCCTSKEHQDLLYDLNVIHSITELLTSKTLKVKVKSLQALAVLCKRNYTTCQSILKGHLRGNAVMDILTDMLSRAQPVDIQINTAKCLTYIYRSGIIIDEGVIERKVLPCLVRMCDSSRNIEERVVGAKTLAYLIETQPKLQRIALICEQFPKKLEAFFRHPTIADTQNMADMRKFKHELGHRQEMLEAVFLAYAALLSNDEDIRDLVVSDTLVKRLAEELSNTSPTVRIASLKSLLSLSRSVRILRTIFEDMEVWKHVLKVTQDQTVGNNTVGSDREKVAVSALLCNLLLDFSPCKVKLLNANILQTFKIWLKAEYPLDLKRNATWGLLNVTFQAELKLKMEVMHLISPDIFMLLTCSDYDIVIKTLGILNNVLTNKEHTDAIMNEYGDAIMQACMITLESTSLPNPNPWSRLGNREVSSSIYTHTLCVLGCVAAGDGVTTVRKFLYENEHFLKKLIFFMEHPDLELQIAAVQCISTLCQNEDDEVIIRREKMKELGAVEALHKLNVNCATASLCDRVKLALMLFQLQGNL
ncbi:armadillo repeat-containing protein 8-like isoform X2 [Clavelina lepadiformis]|uniref:armadillo repeat-containing protein 8-like isoform X2 n=1 Tax=Clavelina lepadiformis TaxID=159417 RepID=UPI004042C930